MKDGTFRKRLRASAWFGILAGVFAGGIAMYAAWLLNAGQAIRSGDTIHWGAWLRIGGGWALAVGLLLFLVSWALSGFYPPVDGGPPGGQNG